MSWVDIAIIALVVLFGGLGVWKGVQKSALSLGAFLIAFIISFFLAGVVAEALLNIDGIKNFVLGGEGWSLYTWIDKGMGSSPWLDKSFTGSTFFKPMFEVVNNCKSKLPMAFTVHDGVALCAAFTLFAALVGIALFIVVRALLCIATMIIKSYIPRKKSAGNRVGGFFVGAVRGAAWALVITIIFSTVGGLTFASAIDKTEDEYEKSVFGKPFNTVAYSLKNDLFIPDEEQFIRLLNKSGIGAKKDEGEEEKPLTPVEKERNRLYAEIMNLNYKSGSRFTVNETTGALEEHTEITDVINPDDFTEIGFKEHVKAVVEYNNKIGAAIKSGVINSADIDKIAEYADVRLNIYGYFYGAETGMITPLRDYTAIFTDETFGTLTEEKPVNDHNKAMKEDYDIIVAAFDGLKTEYAKFDLLVASSQVGELTIPAYPELKVETVKAA